MSGNRCTAGGGGGEWILEALLFAENTGREKNLSRALPLISRISASVYPPVFLSANTSRRVDFPAPLGPIRATIVPGTA